MNKKIKEAKDGISYMKANAIGDIVVGSMLCTFTAFAGGMLVTVKELLPRGIVVGALVLLGLAGFATIIGGIMGLRYRGKIAEVLKDIAPDEDDE